MMSRDIEAGRVFFAMSVKIERMLSNLSEIDCHVMTNG